MDQLGVLDAACLYFDKPHAPINASTIWIYDGSSSRNPRPSFQDVFDHLASRIDLIPALRKKTLRVPGEIDLPWWVDDQYFDLEYHVRHIPLPAPGNWQQFRDQVARLHSRRLDPTRPLWELYMIDGLNDVKGIPPNAFALVFKSHHALVDGKLIMTITSILHSDLPSRRKSPVTNIDSTNELLLKGTALTHGMAGAALQPFRAMRALGGLAPGISRLRKGRESTAPKLPPVPKTRFNSVIDSSRVLDTIFYDLDTVKKIRAGVPDATINDIALAIFGGALRQYLRKHNDLPTAPLRAAAPVALRDTAASDAIGNKFSLMVVNLATDIADPRERLAAVCAGTQQAKNSGAGSGSGSATPANALDIIPAMLWSPGIRALGLLMERGLNIGINTAVSNIPGPKPPLHIMGCNLIRLTGAGPIVDGMGLINYITSYAGEVGFGYTSCRKLMPDPEYYSACIDQSFRSMCSIIKKPRRARRKSS